MATKSYINMRLGDIIIALGFCTKAQIEDVYTKKEPHETIGDALVRAGYVTEEEIARALAEQQGLNYIDLLSYSIDEQIIEVLGHKFSQEFAMENECVPVRIEGKVLHIATSDPGNLYTLSKIKALGYKLTTYVSTRNLIIATIEKLYGFSKTMKDLGINSQSQELEREEKEAVYNLNKEEDSPIVSLVNQLIVDAYRQKSSDIHIDPLSIGIEVRFRIDGNLKVNRNLPKSLLKQISSRIKIMSHLDITESRLPQDGRIKMEIDGKRVDLRVSCLPTVQGEKIVLRVLDLSATYSGLENLITDEKMSDDIKTIITKPHGLFLVSGPTGSGKTTTLYTCLSHVNNKDINIITVEDPVEIQLQGVNQVQVNPDIDLTFVNALRSILRQDPNIVMIGEIRDSETAKIAVSAAQTGHLVLSTIHTNDSIQSINRLSDLGIQPFMVSSTLQGIIAQRLIRRVCPHCSTESKPTASELEVFKSQGVKVDKVKRAGSCDRCFGDGYIGRMGVYELCMFNDELRHAISNNATDIELKDIARKNGTKFLYEQALTLVAQGHTTLEEAIKMTME